MKLLSYFSALIFVLIFTLLCSTRVGGFLLLVMIFAPIISLMYAKYVSKKILVSISLEENIISKGATSKLFFDIQNNSILPSPLLEINFMDNANISCDEKNIYIAVSGKKHAHKHINFTEYSALRAGGSYIGIEDVYVRDFFGIHKYMVCDEKFLKIGIIPDIVEVSEEENALRNSTMRMFGDSEETVEETSITFTGNPGYEYRQYIPGDPLKRINSKLSAKRDELWVRLDERLSVSTIDIVIDPCISDIPELNRDAAKIAELTEGTIEQALGIVFVLLRKDFAINFRFVDHMGEWCSRCITDENNINILMDDMAQYIFRGTGEFDGKRVPPAANGKECNMIFCTPCEDEGLRAEIGELNSKDNTNIEVYSVYGSILWREGVEQ